MFDSEQAFDIGPRLVLPKDAKWEPAELRIQWTNMARSHSNQLMYLENHINQLSKEWKDRGTRYLPYLP